ncbi:MAG: cupin domain-containing protein [Phyllobacteriaceae bacterium]|nr:cupin domain-containing protein [Phyllobacteriaceae bacterium]
MAAPQMPAFDPFDVEESNRTTLPEPFATTNRRRWNRRLGDFAGLTNFGVNLTRIEPGGQSSFRHAHSKQDEFVWVVEGEVVLVTDAGRQVLKPGSCAGFPAGTGLAHHFLNEGTRDALLLTVGDRTPGDAVGYPEVDLAGRYDEATGLFGFTHKDGSPY